MSSKVVHHMEGLHGRQSDFMTFSSLSSVVEKSGPVVWISPQASISATCDLLRTHRCLSMPVYDKEKRRILGLVDILDICGFLCWGSMNFFKQNAEKAVLDEQDRELKAKMNEVPIVDVLNAKQQHHGTLVVKRQLDSVCSLLDLMAQGLHRALVQVWPEDEDEEGQSLEHYRLVAQVDVVRFLVDHKRNLNHHLIASSLADLGLAGPTPSDPSSPAASSSSSAAKSLIYSIEEGKTALEAFRTMAVSGVHAIGIIGALVGSADGSDQQPRLLYNLSASDLRDILTPDTVHLLREPVEVFLARVQEKDPKGRPKNLVTCSPGDSLLQVMELVVRSRVHRVWVVDRQHRPLGLVTLTDILSKFASFDYALAQAAVKKTIVPLSLSSPH